jgi:VWFA-related protein
MAESQFPGVRRRNLVALRLLAVLAVGLLSHGSVWAQSSERSMFVSVLDASGGPVEGLTPTDFVVEEDGSEREVLRVGPATAPMQVAVLVDTSAAAAFATSNVRNGLEAFVSKLHTGNEIALVTFGGRPQILVESTGRIDRLRDGIGRIFAFPETAAFLLDALFETARGFDRREAARPVIVVVTSEGVDYSSNGSRRVLDALRETQVATHTIVMQDPQNTALRASQAGGGEIADGLYQRDLVLARGPEATGGQRRDLLLSTAIGDALEQLAVVLTSQYEVVYSRPASLVPPEDIAVRMRRAELSAQGTPVRHAGD